MKKSLRKSTEEKLLKIGECPLVVGIPCYNSESTIRYVVETSVKGLKQFFPNLKSVVITSDGGSLDDTRENASKADIPEGIENIVSIHRGEPGKGAALKAVFEAASRLNASAICVFDSDLRSVTPEWIKLFLSPVIDKGYDFCAPVYKRDKRDGTITNSIVYPLTRALYGLQIRQPIGGDFAFSGRLARYIGESPLPSPFVEKFGIDIYITTTAINEGFNICQVNPGVKIHNPKDPAQSLGPMFMQVIHTLFSLVEKYDVQWKEIKHSKKPKTFTLKNDIPPEPVKVSIDKLKDELKDGFSNFFPLWEQIISSDTFKSLEKAARGEVPFSAELWVKIVYDFIYTFHIWKRNRHKLIDIMAPLYFGRAGAFMTETENLTNEQAEQIIEHQAIVFEKGKEYLIKRWFNES